MPATRYDVDRKHDSTHNNTHTRRALVLEVQQPDGTVVQAPHQPAGRRLSQRAGRWRRPGFAQRRGSRDYIIVNSKG